MNRFRFARLLLLAFVPATLVVAGGTWLLARSEMRAQETVRDEAEKRDLARTVRGLSRNIEALSRDALYLAQGRALSLAIDNPSPEALTRVGEDFVAFSRSQRIYDKVRWIDAQGMEVVRVDLVDGRAVVIPPDRLQPKGRRYFVSDTLALRQGEVFVSPFDLNVERDLIEVPHKPTIRVGTPLFARGDGGNRPAGLLLLNYLGRELIDEYERATAGSSGRAMLVNRDGYWLKAPVRADEWGFMFGRRDTMATRHKDAWSNISSSAQGQFEDADGLWTFDTVRPLIAGQRSSRGSGDIHAPSVGPLPADEYYWKAVTHIPAPVLRGARAQVLRRYVAPFGALMALALGASILLAQAWERRRHAENELRNSNFELERNVAVRTAELLEREQEHRQLLEDSPFPIAVARRSDAVMLYGNPAFLRMMGLEWEQLRTRRVTDFYGSRDERRRVLETIRETGQADAELRLQTADGREIDVVAAMRGVRFAGEPAIIASMTDISTRKAAEIAVRDANARLYRHLKEIEALQASLQEQAIRDSLTGLYNRRFMEETLTHELARAQREGYPVAVAMFDLDHFKRVNDTYGHAAGDQVLVAVGQLLQQHARVSDTACRYGGEEFVLLLPGISLADAKVRIEQLRRSFVDHAIPFGEFQLSVTVSAGVAAYPAHGLTAREIIDHADEALYRAKHAGRNRVETWGEVAAGD